MNSHVQIPSSVLKSFSKKQTINDNGRTIKKNMIYCLKMDGNISCLDIKDCNTVEGYYHPEIEELLSKSESKFGEVKKRIIQYVKNKNTELSISNEDFETIVDFYKLYFYRSQNVVEKIKKKSVACQIFDVPVENMAVAMGLNKAIKFNGILDNFVDIQILINQSNKNFIIPQQGLYHIEHENMNWLVMPLSPQIAISLVDKHFPDILAIRTLDDNAMLFFNAFAIRGEFNSNKQALYAKNLTDFDDYKILFEDLKNRTATKS